MRLDYCSRFEFKTYKQNEIIHVRSVKSFTKGGSPLDNFLDDRQYFRDEINDDFYDESLLEAILKSHVKNKML